MDINVPRQLYPFATKDGRVIPLDIVKSEGFILSAFTNSSDTQIDIPVGSAEVALLYATNDCVILFNDGVDPTSTPALGAIATNTLYENVVFVPKNHVITVALAEGVARVRGLSASGNLYIQLITKWAGLSIPVDYRKR